MRHVLEMLESRLLLNSHPVIDFGAEIEPNDTRETATVLPESPFQPLRPCFLNAAGIADCPPTLYSGYGILADRDSPHNSADVDFWSIRLVAGNSINLLMHGSSATVGVLPELQDADGQVVAHSKAHDDNGDGTPDSTGLEFIAETGGVFFIQLGPGGGRYALHAAVHGDRHIPPDPHVEHEPNDTFDTAQDIPLSWPTDEVNVPSEPRADGSAAGLSREAHGFVRGNLENGEVSPDTDFYRITVRPELTIDVRVSGAGAQGGHMTVYDQQHNIIAEADPNAEENLSAKFESTYEGSYFIQLTDTGTVVCITTPCLTYELKITARHEFVDPYAEQEPNDTIETANPLHQVGPWIPMPLEGVADSGAITATIGRPESDVICLAIGCGDPSWWNRRAAFLVHGDLSTQTDAADTDYFSFPAGENHNIIVSYNGVAAGDIELIDADGNVLARATSSLRDNGEDKPNHGTIEFFTPVGGTFYVQLSRSPDGASTRASNYDLHVITTHEPVVEHEPNDSLETANGITLYPKTCESGFTCFVRNGIAYPNGTTGNLSSETPLQSWFDDPWWTGYISGELIIPFVGDRAAYVSDTDFFKFEALPERSIHVSLAGPLARLGGLIELFDSDGSFLASDRDYTDGLEVRSYSRSGGLHFVKVSLGGGLLYIDPNSETCAQTSEPNGVGCTGDNQYTLHVELISEPSVEHEPNNSIETANEIELHGDWRWPCEFDVCPPADADGIAGNPADSGTPDEARAANLGLRPIRWPEPRTLHGFIEGELENVTCPPDALCIAVVQPGVDYFVFDVPAEQHVSIHLTGPLAHSGGVLTLLDADGAALAADDDGSDGLSVDWRAIDGGTFYVQVTGGSGFVELLSCNDTPSIVTAICESLRTYRVDVTAEPLSNPIEGPDEHEPNDTMEQANEIELPRVGDAVCLAIGCPPAPLPGEHSRDRVVHGIAGGPTHDVDYFSFQVLAGEQVSVGVGHDWRIQLDPHANILDPAPDSQPPLFVTVFDSEGNEIGRTAGDSTKPIVFDSELGGVYFVRVELLPDAPDAEVADYRLHIHASKFSHDGPDESEPNDTFDEANPIELVSLPTFAPGIELRGGDARGIAGGPNHDQDVFSFEAQAGEHVTVGVTGFGRNLGECPQGFSSDGTACVQVHGPSSPQPTERLPHFEYDRPIHVMVFDAEGNEIGAAEGSDGHPDVVSFDAAAAGEYFAVVSVSTDTDALVRYRLGVLAQLTLEPDELPIVEKPMEIVLRHGQSYRFTDSDGDAVQIVFQGRGGAAHVMFDGSDANGSDIVSVDIAGVRRGGNFRVRTAGSAEVGSLDINGLAGRARRTSSYGNVTIDGNLGSFSSSLNLRSLAVDGILGEVYAPGRQIGQVSAMVFDSAMADVGSIRTVHVEAEMSSAIFELFLPEDEQP